MCVRRCGGNGQLTNHVALFISMPYIPPYYTSMARSDKRNSLKLTSGVNVPDCAPAT